MKNDPKTMRGTKYIQLNVEPRASLVYKNIIRHSKYVTKGSVCLNSFTENHNSEIQHQVDDDNDDDSAADVYLVDVHLELLRNSSRANAFVRHVVHCLKWMWLNDLTSIAVVVVNLTVSSWWARWLIKSWTNFFNHSTRFIWSIFHVEHPTLN